MSFPSDFADDDWDHHAPTPPAVSHPHPLRSHSAEDLHGLQQQIDATAAAFSRSDRPDSCVLTEHAHDQRRPVHADRGHRDSFAVRPPLPTYASYSSVSTEGLGDLASAASTPGSEYKEFKEYPLVPVRPPLKPTISFGGETRVSYYSFTTNATTELDQKSKSVAVEEELRHRRRSQQSISARGPGWRFYASLAILCSLRFVCGMGATALATVLPDVAQEFGANAVSAFWIANSFLLASAMLQPLFMRLSYALGGRLLLALGIALCTGGAVACAMAKDLPLLILGRVIAGCGSGALGVLTHLILHHLARPKQLSTSERLTSLIYWLGAALGPIVGAAAAQSAGWRYIFWLNVPFGAFALITLTLLLSWRSKDGSEWAELTKIDYLGWILLVGSVVPVVVAVSWAGPTYQWQSWHVETPLIIGLLGAVIFIQYSRYRLKPIMPIGILGNAIGMVSCFGTVIHGMVFTAVVYLLPILLQTAHNLTPLTAALALAPWTFALVFGGAVAGSLFSAYGHRWAIRLGWPLIVTGTGLMVLLRHSTSTLLVVPIGLAIGIGLGLLLPALSTAVQSAASTDDEAIHAAPLHTFFSTLGQALGVAVGSCVFLNQLHSHLAAAKDNYFAVQAQMYTQNAVALVSTIPRMPIEQINQQAKLIAGYTDATRWVWITMSIVSGVALMLSAIYTWDARRPQPSAQHGQDRNGRALV